MSVFFGRLTWLLTGNLKITTKFSNCWVSTVSLPEATWEGLGYRYETAVFWEDGSDVVATYSDFNGACEGHRQMVASLYSRRVS